MKIVCDKCATKYSIADEKVRGKVFKIRCKKCGHIIVVKGGEGVADGGGDATASEDNADAVAGPIDSQPGVGAGTDGGDDAASGDRVWFLVIAGDQVGPFTATEVRGKFSAGEIDAETYAWREGFADWLRVASIEDFHDLGSAAPSLPAADSNGSALPDAGNGADANDVFGAPRHEEEDGGDIFGRSQAPAAASPSHELFGSAGHDADLAPPRAAAAAPAAGGALAEPDQKLTGQRNENSMLFSLSNLQALATGGGNKPSAQAAAAPASASTERPGYASAKNEGSGLIDIRAMAAATLSSAGSSSSSTGASTEVPSFSAAPVFSPVVAAPMMVPQAQSGMPKWVWGVVGVGGLLFVGLIGAVGYLIFHKPEMPSPLPPVAMNLPANPAAGTAAAGPAGGPAVAPAAGSPAAAAPGTEPKADVRADKEDKSKSRHDKSAAAAKKGDKGAAAVATAPSTHSAAPSDSGKSKKGGGGGDDLDALLDSATGGSSKRSPAAVAPRPEPAEDANLPDQLDRGDVLAGMRGVQSKVQGCYQQYHVPGIAMVNVTIAKSGHVSSAKVGGALAGTPTGDCVARAVKSASFKRFKGASMSIQYPFQLR